ncbi:MAG: porin [Gammaproteobacteria bacterium]
MNEIHAHADSFVDRPLPYRAFLGGDNLHDDGVQLSFLLPTAFYAEVGGGAFRGASFPAAGSGSSGAGTTTLFGRVGGDIGVSQSWLAGLSWLRGEAVNRETGDLTFNGTTHLYAADAKYTWSPNGNLANRSLVLQAEYLWRNEDGAYNGIGYDRDTDGWYAQAVYKFHPQWKVGYRYSHLGAASVPLALAGTALDSGGHNPLSQSLLLEWDNSEFSSLRLQYTRDESGPVADDEAVLRYTISMGAHGAHQY